MKNWFVTFGLVRLIRSDRGPPFPSATFKRFYESYCIGLNLTAPYHPGAKEQQSEGWGWSMQL